MRSTANHLIAGMMMLAAILLVWNRSAHAALEVLEDFIEARAQYVSLPLHDAAQVVARRCQGCTPTVLRVNADTRYHVSSTDQAVKREEFLGMAATAPDKSMIGIAHERGGDLVLRLILGIPSQK
jgi:hypothetical protein